MRPGHFYYVKYLVMRLMLKARRKRENPGAVLADSFIFSGEAGYFQGQGPQRCDPTCQVVYENP